MEQLVKRLEVYYNAFWKAIPRIALAIVIIIIGILIARWVTRFLEQRIKTKSHDPLMSGFLAKAIRMILFICVTLLALHVAGLSGIAAAILATAGASAIVIGFAFKDIAENFIAGIILAFNRPFHVNDTVKIEDVFGKVKEMEFRYTKIATFDGRNVYIPNADVLQKPVYNYTEDGFYRGEFIVGIAYENDAEEAKKIIEKCLMDDDDVVKDEIHVNFAIVDELAASTVNLKVLFWLSTEDFRRGWLQVRGRLIQSVKSELEQNGFNLPAEIRELKFYDASKPFSIDGASSRKEHRE